MSPINANSKKILIVAPFMHRLGHFSVFPVEMAEGFSMNGASVTVLHPFAAQTPAARAATARFICLADETQQFGGTMRVLWRMCRNNPILLCLAWLVLHIRAGSYDLVYWADFKSDNQQSMWPLGLAALARLYRHRTGFTEHHNFSWTKHRWQRLFRLDRLRLRHVQMFVHSRKLLDWIRLNMAWPSVGHYVPHGLWPAPVSDAERHDARTALGIADEARVLLVFGLQAVRRKEIDTLADALRPMTLDKPLVLLFVGMKVKDEPHPFDRPEFAAKHNLHIRHHESFIPDEAVKSFFAAADAVWAYYGAFLGASGVLAQSIAFGRMSICSDEGESGEVCRRYPVGLPARTGSLESVQAVLSRFMSMPPDEQTAFEAANREAAGDMAWPRVTRQILDVMLTPPSAYAAPTEIRDV